MHTDMHMTRTQHVCIIQVVDALYHTYLHTLQYVHYNNCMCNYLYLSQLPVLGHNKHCPDETNDIADSSKQHCS